jgi:hypothetical protein
MYENHFKNHPPNCFRFVALTAFFVLICNMGFSQFRINADGSAELLNTLKGNQSGAVRISTGTGYVDIGPQSTSYCHINTDRSTFSFNKNIYFPGLLYISSNFVVYQLGQSYPIFQVVPSTSRVGIALGPNSPQYTLDCGTQGIIRALNVNPSDINLKKDIKDLPVSRVTGLYGITAKTYKYKTPVYYTTETTKVEGNNKSPDADKEFIGLIAQDIRKVYPELVFEDSLGILSLNYDGLIPVIIEALKSQNQQIQDLKAAVASLAIKPKSAESLVGNNSNSAKLLQNVPNPFTQNTNIEFYLPATVNKATMYIYDLQGKQVKSISIIQRESGSIIIYGSELWPGMYYYTLIADEKIVDTRQLILTD